MVLLTLLGPVALGEALLVRVLHQQTEDGSAPGKQIVLMLACTCVRT